MAGLQEKVAYLQGLINGLGVSSNGREGEVFSGMLELLGDIASEISDIREAQAEMSQYLEYIDLDLGELEEEVYDDEDSLDLVEAECPHCGQTVYFEEDVLSSDEPLEVTCPGCGVIVYNSEPNQESEPVLVVDSSRPGEGTRV